MTSRSEIRPLAARARIVELSLSEIAGLVGGELVGDGDLSVSVVRPISEAGPGELAFLANRRYAGLLEGCRASAYLVGRELAPRLPEGANSVVVEEPRLALASLLHRLHPPRHSLPDIHPTAIIDRRAELGERVAIGPYAVVEGGASVGAGARIGAHSVVGRGAKIGEDSLLHPHVVIYADCQVGARCVVHSGARIGSDGFGFVFGDGEHRKIPQVGRALVGDDVEIGANSTIDRGSIGDTVVGPGTKLDNLVHLAHNVRVGARSLFAAMVGVAGSTKVGSDVWMGGMAGVSDHLAVGDGARLAIASKVMRDVPAGVTVSGHPARPHRRQMRRQAAAARIGRLDARVRRLEVAAGLRERRSGPQSPSRSG